MKLCDYTVILFVYDGGDFETFVSFIKGARSPAAAEARGRRIAARTSKGEYKPDDFYVTAVIVGSVVLWPGCSQSDFPNTPPCAEDLEISKATRGRRSK